MSDSDLPTPGTVEDTPLSARQGDEAIGNLLDNLGSDLVENEEQAQAPDAQTAPSPDQGEDDDDGLVIDEEGDGLETDAPEEPEFNGGRFASDDAKVKLEDGTTISVADLKRNNLFQKDYSKKTEELATQRKQFEQEIRQITETANLVAQQREVILTLAKELLPQEPSIPDDPNDPVAYIEYRRDKDLWDQKMGKLQGLWQAKQQDEAKLTQQQQAEFADLKKVEFEKLTTAIPSLKDEKRLEQFRNEAIDIGTSAYGLTPEEIGNVVDHRLIRVLADAIAYRKAIAKRDAGKAPPAPNNQQPRIIQKQRMASTPQQRDANNAFERLRNTGSARDGEAALMKFLT